MPWGSYIDQYIECNKGDHGDPFHSNPTATVLKDGESAKETEHRSTLHSASGDSQLEIQGNDHTVRN